MEDKGPRPEAVDQRPACASCQTARGVRRVSKRAGRGARYVCDTCGSQCTHSLGGITTLADPGAEIASEWQEELAGCVQAVELGADSERIALRDMLDNPPEIPPRPEPSPWEKLQAISDPRERLRKTIVMARRALGVKDWQHDTFSAADMMAYEPPSGDRYAVEDLIPYGRLTMLLGDPHGGKTTLSRDLTWRLLRGGHRFLGREIPEAVPVLAYVLEGGGPAVIRDIYEKMGLLREGFHVTGAMDTASAMERRIADTGARVVLIDTLGKWYRERLEDSKDYTKVVREMAPLEQVATDTSAAIVPLHHRRKAGGKHGQAAMDSAALLAACGSVIELELSAPDDPDSPRYVTAFGKDGVRSVDKTLVRLDDSTGLCYLTTPAAPLHETVITKIMDAGEAGVTVSDLAQGRGRSKKKVQKVLDLLVQNGKVDRVRNGGPIPDRYRERASVVIPLRGMGTLEKNHNQKGET